jgi:hypothetical protein
MTLGIMQGIQRNKRCSNELNIQPCKRLSLKPHICNEFKRENAALLKSPLLAAAARRVEAAQIGMKMMKFRKYDVELLHFFSL